MFRATGPGKVDLDLSWSGVGMLKALLYNFDFDDFADRKIRALKSEHIAFLADKVLPLLENNRGNVWLEGSASRMGANAWNMETSQTREGRVAAYLADHGVNWDQMQVDAVGEEVANKLKHTEDDPRDRSVTIWVLPRINVNVPLPKRVPPKPKMSQTKLYIYDTSDWIDRLQARGRFSGQHDVLTFGIQNGIKGLLEVFNQLLRTGQHFNRVVFQTHGSPGVIWFGDAAFTASGLKTHFQRYSPLFPTFTRIYFDGCNVAKGADGTDFLIAAGEAFLRAGGGDVFGWKNLGSGMPGFLPFIGGHTIHFSLSGSDNFKRIRFFPGGSPDWPDSFVN
jgi:hypothetical protein